MVNAGNAWMLANPLWSWVLGTLLAGIIAALVTLAWPTIVKFSALPPQRLNIRILKARKDAAEAKLVWTNRIQEDTRFLIFECFVSLIFWQAGLAFLIASFIMATQVLVKAGPHAMPPFREFITSYLTECGSIIIGYIAFRRIIDIINSMRRPKTTVGELTERIEKLKLKLTLKIAV